MKGLYLGTVVAAPREYKRKDGSAQVETPVALAGEVIVGVPGNSLRVGDRVLINGDPAVYRDNQSGSVRWYLRGEAQVVPVPATVTEAQVLQVVAAAKGSS